MLDLYTGEGLNEAAKVLLQESAVELAQVGVNDRVVHQLSLVRIDGNLLHGERKDL